MQLIGRYHARANQLNSHLSVCLGFVQKISSELLSFVTRLNVGVHHYELQCHVEKLGCCGHGHSESLHNVK